VLAKYYPLNNVLAAYFCKILHPVGGQPDANFIQLVASRMQAIDKFGGFFFLCFFFFGFKEHFSIFFVQYLGVTAGIEPAT
jgi:hypothetical protein